MVRWALCLSLLAAPAWGRHDAARPATDYSAYTLNGGEWRLGLWRLGVGLFDSVELSSIWPLLLLKVGNAQVKWTAWRSGGYAASAELGIFTLDIADWTDPEPGARLPTARVIPFTLTGTSRHDDFSFNAGIAFTLFEMSGEFVAEDDVSAVGGASTIMLKPAIEWRLGPVFALVFDARIKLYERFSGNVVTTYPLDDDSEIDVYGTGGLEVTGAKGQIGLTGLWSWDTFNLRLGGAYGHYAVPVVNVFVPRVLFVPEIDLFWRF